MHGPVIAAAKYSARPSIALQLQIDYGMSPLSTCSNSPPSLFVQQLVLVDLALCLLKSVTRQLSCALQIDIKLKRATRHVEFIPF